MSDFHVIDRWGHTEAAPSMGRLREVIATLDLRDEEHPDVALEHATGWCLSAFPSGLVVWENVEDGDHPRHMKNVPRSDLLDLWTKLARGDIEAVESESWLPGYGGTLR